MKKPFVPDDNRSYDSHKKKETRQSQKKELIPIVYSKEQNMLLNR